MPANDVAPRLFLRVRPLAGNRARGWLMAGPFRFPCALGPSGMVRIKREASRDAGRAVQAVVGLLPAGRPLAASGGRYVKPIAGTRAVFGPVEPRTTARRALPAADCTDCMWRDDHLDDLTFVLDQTFLRRARVRQRDLLHLARPGLTPTAGRVAISLTETISSTRGSRAARS